MPSPGHQRLWTLIDTTLPAAEADRARALVAPLAAELDRYTEVIVAPGEVALGFMTRGDDAGFTDRSAALLRALGMPEAAVAHHARLAAWFDHRRAFLKIEWRRQGDGMVPRASCYFRRRPPLAEVAARLGLFGRTLETVTDVARLTGKKAVHFVAAAFAAGRPIEQKLYFSQYASPENRSQMAAHLDTLLERFGMTPGARELFARVHPRCLPAGSPTFFVSINLGPDGPAPTLKVDYPDVSPAVAASWRPAGGERAGAEALASRVCELAEVRELTYLGVRFEAGADDVRLKYYLDLPAVRA